MASDREADPLDASLKAALARVRMVGVEGARVEDVNRLVADLSKLGKFQVMDAGCLLGEDHVRFACFEALRSFKSGQNLTASLPMEMLVRAACTTQISEAIARVGVKKGCREVVLVAVEADQEAVSEAVALLGGKVSPSPLKPTPAKRARVKGLFSLSEPVEKALLERIALSSVG